MKKTILILMFAINSGVLTGVEPGPPQSINPTPPVPAPAPDFGTLQTWSPLLKEMGVEPGKNMATEQYNLLIKKLSDLPKMAKNIEDTLHRHLPVIEWISILRGMGIDPKPRMTNDEWGEILVKAGVEPLGYTPPAKETEAVPVQNNVPTAAKTAPNASKKITLDMHGMDVQEVFKILSRQSGLNIISGPSVRGNVTISLKDVDVWEALRLIAEINNLAYVQEDSFVQVMTDSDYERDYGAKFDDKTKIQVLILKNVKALAIAKYLDNVKSRFGKIIVYDLTNSLILLDTRESITKMAKLAGELDQPQETKVFDINYAKAEDILTKFNDVASKETSQIEIDKRTNRIIATDSPEKIRQMEKIVQAFDGRHRSVLIEAKIVQVTLNSQYQMGINWERVFSGFNDSNLPGDVKANFNILPTGGLGLTATLGTLGLNQYTALMQFLETIGKTNLLSSPRITAISNEAAQILVGTKEAYVTTTVTAPGGGGPVITSEQVNYVDVGVKLYVTPVISDDGYITMKIKPEVSSVDRTITTAQGNTIPILRTSQADASVVAKDGETIIIAGLNEDRLQDSKNGIPWLGRIPILGFPFRNHSKTKVKTEIVVFLTPKIMTSERVTEQKLPVEKTKG